MTTLLVLLLVVSPISAFVMIYNQCKLEKMLKTMQDSIQYLRDNSLLISNKELLKALKSKKDVEMSSIEFNTED